MYRAQLLILIVGGALAGLTVAEVALRVAGYNAPIVSVADPILGHFRRPSVDFVYTDEGRAQVRINRYGFRDRERSISKPQGTYRIAVLGDSYAEAYQVDIENTFWAILETELNQCERFKNKVDVMNFGVSGYGTAQELQMLRSRVWGFDPDFVLLAFLTGNDVRNNSPVLEPERRRPFYRLDAAGQLILDESFRSEPDFIRASSSAWSSVRLLLDDLRVVQVVGRARTRYLEAKQQSFSANDAVPENGGEPGLDDHVYMDEAGPAWDEAWMITEALLARINSEIQVRGKEFLVVTLSNGIQVHPDKEVTAAYMRRRGIGNIFLPDERIAGFGQKHGFSVLTLAPGIRERAMRSGTYMHGFGSQVGYGHWNERGHRAAAEMIGNYLCNGTERSAR